MNADALDFTSAILFSQFDTFSQEIYFSLESYSHGYFTDSKAGFTEVISDKESES